MENSYTETTSKSWGNRIMESLKGILFGLLLVALAFIVLWWNEGRAVKTAKSLEEGASSVVTISSSAVAKENEQKLVHLTGMATTNEILIDADFKISLPAIKLRRIVEMYQWKEEKSEKKEKKMGGSEETVTTYSYKKVWDDNIISSENFKQKEGHTNPTTFQYSSSEKIAQNVQVGGFTLSPSLIQKINKYEKLNPQTFDSTQKSSQEIYIGRGNINSPEIGDVKISFEAVKPIEVSIVAKQVGNSFEPYKAEAGGEVELLEYGNVPAAKMFSEAQSTNTTMTWIFRIAGIAMMFFGIMTIFKPLVTVADVLPFLGSILNMGLGIFSAVISFSLSFITIALAWLFYRPVLGIILLVIGIGIFVGIKFISPKKKTAK